MNPEKNPENSTPLATFHEDIRVYIGDKDHETHSGYELNRAIVTVLRSGEVTGYTVTPDGQSIEPKLTPESNQDSYNLLVYCATLKFRGDLNKEQIFDLTNKIHDLKNSGK